MLNNLISMDNVLIEKMLNIINFFLKKTIIELTLLIFFYKI